MLGKKRARDKDRNRKWRNTKKATTELTLQSTSQCSSPFSTVFTYDY